MEVKKKEKKGEPLGEKNTVSADFQSQKCGEEQKFLGNRNTDTEPGGFAEADLLYKTQTNKHYCSWDPEQPKCFYSLFFSFPEHFSFYWLNFIPFVDEENCQTASSFFVPHL